jgi:hypothetical protein
MDAKADTAMRIVAFVLGLVFIATMCVLAAWLCSVVPAV